MHLQFRIASERDVPAIVALVESAYRGESSKRGWTTEADLLDGQRTDVAEVSELIRNDPQQAQLVLCESAEGELLASCLLEVHPDGCHFGMFAVRPTLQNAGVGKALIAHAELRAQQVLGANTMVMWVIWTRTTLIEFYQRRGYVLSDERVPFPYGDSRFGLPKRPDLYFVVMHKRLRETVSA
jgi:ribosomal protein S18 acetylase RimI-like enzyme